MPKPGPIVIVDDDMDDQEIITDVLKDIGVSNKLIFFDRCNDAFHYLKTTSDQPFIILCDINLPEMTGLEFKAQVDSDMELKQKSVPFIFMSTAAGKSIVTEAYTKMTIQGFFEKTASMQEIKKSLTVILDYWKLCRHPNSY